MKRQTKKQSKTGLSPETLATKEVVTNCDHLMNRILNVRGKMVMIDRDLAKLYGITTGNLNKAVKRNLDRFPSDFMVRFSAADVKTLIFQNGTSKTGRGGSRHLPYATILDVLSGKGAGVVVRLVCKNRGNSVNQFHSTPTPLLYTYATRTSSTSSTFPNAPLPIKCVKKG